MRQAAGSSPPALASADAGINRPKAANEFKKR
jgi:hypothetical protein